MNTDDNDITLWSLLEPVQRLRKDLLAALAQQPEPVGLIEARILTSTYYNFQESRIALNNRIKALHREAKKKGKEPPQHEALTWCFSQQEIIEKETAKILSLFYLKHPMHWFFAQTHGIGPILSTALIAHIDITTKPTAGTLWSSAGFNPEAVWERGKKRPWNATLKMICWRAGDCFIKHSGSPKDYYGKIYIKRKAYEWSNNISGSLAAQAQENLKKKPGLGEKTEAYKWYSGQCSPTLAQEHLARAETPKVSSCLASPKEGVPMLPPAHIQARATRYAIKLFLAHLWQRWREQEALHVPVPYALAHQGHAHWIEPPQVAPDKKST